MVLIMFVGIILFIMMPDICFLQGKAVFIWLIHFTCLLCCSRSALIIDW